VAVASGCALLSSGWPALADPLTGRAADAEAIIKHGVDLRKRGEDEAALREFQRAYDLAPTPRASAQMGLAEQALGRWPDSETHLDKALAAREDPWIAKNRAVLEESLRVVHSRVARLAVSGEPAGAEVRVDGRLLGTLPLRAPMRLLPGPARVEVRSSGYVTASMTVSLAAGEVTPLEIKLEREGAAPAPSSLVVSRPAPTPVESPPSDGKRMAARLTLVATGVALAVGGAGFAYGETKMRDAKEDGCTKRSDGVVFGPGDVMGDQHCTSLYESGSSGRRLGTIGLVGAGVLGVTSALLYFVF
jgi:hypothetical protein